MKNRYLEFKNVGRANYSGRVLLHPEIVDADDIAYAAYQKARKHLCSRDVETVYDPLMNEGTVFAGLHAVGKFKVIEL